MREILFRGKRTDGEWISGNYIYAPSNEDSYVHNICTPDEPYDWYEIDPETLGQYTGHEDKNNTKIFDGDIVKFNSDYDDWDRFYDNPVIKVEYESLTGGFDPFASYDCDCGIIIESNKCEVVGNIYDNPELLTEN